MQQARGKPKITRHLRQRTLRLHAEFDCLQLELLRILPLLLDPLKAELVEVLSLAELEEEFADLHEQAAATA
jgi:hypothetical protein